MYLGAVGWWFGGGAARVPGGVALGAFSLLRDFFRPGGGTRGPVRGNVAGPVSVVCMGWFVTGVSGGPCRGLLLRTWGLCMRCEGVRAVMATGRTIRWRFVGVPVIHSVAAAAGGGTTRA